MAVRVDDDRDRVARSASRRSARISRPWTWVERVSIDQRRAVAEHDPDVLVVELVAANEHAIAELDPGGHARHGSERRPSGSGPSRRVRSRSCRRSSSHVPTADGTDLLVRHWPADEAAAGGALGRSPWASVLLVHGLGEHSGRYEHVGDQLAAAGLDVHAYDHRGNGGSGGRRGHVERWTSSTTTWRSGCGRSARPPATGRWSLYGHSMGALIVLGYLLRPTARSPDLVVARLAGPRFDAGRLEEGPVARALGRRRRRRWRSRTGSTAPPCRAIPRLARRSAARPGLREDEHGPLRRGGPRRAGASPAATYARPDPADARPPRAGRRARPGLGVGGPGDAAQRRTAHLPGPPPRAPQRARGSGHPRRGDRLAARACYASCGTTEHRLRGAPRALRVWQRPQTRGT